MKKLTEKELYLGFFKKIGKAFNPDSYQMLENLKISAALSYVLKVMLFSFILMALFSIPSIIMAPSLIKEEFQGFSKLNVDIDAEMNSPMSLPPEKPFIVIDTARNDSELKSETILVTQDYISFKGVFNKEHTEKTKDYKNMLDKTNELSKFLTFIFILASPMILILLYIVNLIKFAVVLSIVWLIAFFILKIMKSGVKTKQLTNILLYSSTVLIMLDIIFRPFSFYKYFLPVNIFYGISISVIALVVYILFCSLIVAMIHSKKIKF